MFVRVSSDAEAKLFEAYAPTMVALIKGGKRVEIVRSIEDVPAGCGSEVLTPNVVLHVLVRGLVDLDAEIAKCEKKLQVVALGLNKVRKAESVPNYETTVPPDVREMNEEKVSVCLVVSRWARG